MNNNEQDLILREKIEKREKFDTILAYILLVVILVCIGIVVWLMIADKEDELVPPVDEYTPNYISLQEISNSLNSSTLANRYMNDKATFYSSVSGNSLDVTYVKEELNLNLSMPLVGNELMITVPGENNELVTDIYKEIASIICMHYGNQEKYCRNTLDNMPTEGTDGIRIVINEDTRNIYITTTKSFPVTNEITYKEVTVFNINENDYVLELLDTKISNVLVTTSDVNIKFTGKVDRLTEDISNVTVQVKLYDNENNILGENKYEFNGENPLEVSSTFEVEFILSESLKLENINKYSIEIIK